MSDKLENFIRNNRDQFDQDVPRPELWDNIQTGLTQQAATAGAGSTAAAGTKAGGFAKLALGWKVAIIGAVATAITTTAVMVALNTGGGTDQPGGGQGPQANGPAPTHQVEPAHEKGLVNPPLAEADVPYATFSVDAAKGGDFELSTGTILHVPGGIFVDAQGKPVKGKVELQYREFHDAADIILSGIPMTYDNQGKEENFQTAGMMEIRGTQGGSPVEIAPGQTMTIAMASFTDETDHNLYYLDPEQGKWVDIGRAKMSENERKAQALQELGMADARYAADSTPARDSAAYMAAMTVIDLNTAAKNGTWMPGRESGLPRKPFDPAKANESIGIGFSADYQDFPEIKTFKNIQWQSPNPETHKKNQWVFKQVWNDVELVQMPGAEMRYQFVLTNFKKKKKARIEAIPVLEKEDYKKALADFNQQEAKYKKLRTQRQEEGQRFAIQADVIRTFGIGEFGVYNCDRFYKAPGIVNLRAKFDLGDDVYVDARQMTLFHVCGDGRAVISYYGLGEQLFTYSKLETNHLVAILPGAELAVFGPADFARIESARDPKAIYTIQLHRTGRKVRDAHSLRAALGV